MFSVIRNHRYNERIFIGGPMKFAVIDFGNMNFIVIVFSIYLCTNKTGNLNENVAECFHSTQVKGVQSNSVVTITVITNSGL
jgi:hypothetical protein